MRILLAALAGGTTDRLVLDSSLAVAELLDASVRAIHITEPGENLGQIHALARAAGVDLVIADGPVETGLQQAAAGSDIIALGLSASSGRAGNRPIAGTARSLFAAVRKTLVVVPPGARVSSRLQRILVPLDEARVLPAAARRLLAQICGGDREVTILHIHGAARFPMFSDQPHHEAPVWAREFLARVAPGLPGAALHLDTRVGVPATDVVVLAAAADVVALTWYRDLSDPGALVVRRLIERGSCPIILIPWEGRRPGHRRRTDRRSAS